MKTGVIIGKFMPVHKGHMALIDFGLKNCDRLTILFGPRAGEPIDPELRLKWLREIYGRDGRVRINTAPADMPDSPVSDRGISRIWADYLLRRYGHIDRIFSSEKYGQYLAEYTGAENYPFDPKRKELPVSGTMIRNNPFVYWDYIPEAVRPYFVKKVCVYGPESTGKTTLTAQLARHFATVWVPEMARDILGDRHCVYEDMEKIARRQSNEIDKKIKIADKLLFCDTDHITTRIYSEYYFGKVPRLVDEMIGRIKYDLYLFLDIDVPWVADSQRDAGHLREYFRAWFRRGLEEKNIPYTVISGDWRERFDRAVDVVSNKFPGFTVH